MEVNMKILSLFIVSLILIGCDQSDQTYKLVSMSETAKQTTGQSKETSDWLYGFDVLRKYKVGSFNCYVPDSGEGSFFSCSKGNQLLFHHTGDSISIPLSKKRTLMLKDNNMDGEFDLLNYDISDESGNMIGVITDLNLDGKADWRILFNEGVEVFVEGNWQVVKSTNTRQNGQRIFNMIVGDVLKDVVWNGKEYVVSQ